MRACVLLLIVISLAVISAVESAARLPLEAGGMDSSNRGKSYLPLRPKDLESASRINPSAGSLIKGTSKSDVEAQPHLVWVFLWMFPMCKGTIIGVRHILTVAHCRPVASEMLLIMFVEHTEFVAQILAFSTHPQFNRLTFDHDVGIIRTLTPIQYGELVRPIALASTNNLTPGTLLTVQGNSPRNVVNGTGTVNGPFEVDIPLWGRSDCAEIYPLLPGTTFCLGGNPEGLKGACRDDIGGPAIYRDGPGGSVVQYGIISAIHDCDRPSLPSYYTDLASVYAWIASTATLG